MKKKELIEKIIKSSINEFNEFLDSSSKLKYKDSEELIGPNGKLDSLGIIMFLGTLEDKTLHYSKIKIILLNQEYLVDLTGPYKNISSLKEYLNNQLSN